jgi:hypothetical protein
LIEVLGRPVPATNTDDGIRAVRGRNPIDLDSVRRYLEDKFGDDLKAARSAMQKLARAYTPQGLAHAAYTGSTSASGPTSRRVRRAGGPRAASIWG